MSKPDPFTTPEIYDQIITNSAAGRATFPGVNTVNVTGGLNEDVEEIAGSDANITVLSYRPREVTITNVVWTPEDYHKIRSIVKLYESKKTEKPEELEVLHPVLELHGVSRLYIFEVSNPEFRSREGWVTTFRLREWKPKRTENKKKSTQQIGADGGNYNVNTDVSQIATVQNTPPSEQGVPPPDRGGGPS